MKRKNTYRAESVEQLRVEALLKSALVAGCIIGIDVAKTKFVVTLATEDGEPVKLFRFTHPEQTRTFLAIVTAFKSVVPAGHLKVAMEPTGTYGDAIRHQLVELGVSVWMVSPKQTHDSQALFDNVRSLHDPKSSVLVAKLCAMGLATEWKPPLGVRTRLRALVELRSHELEHQERCFGRLEALLARHWPEFGETFDLRGQRTSLRLLIDYPTPANINADVATARALIRTASRGRLLDAANRLIAAVPDTLGVPANCEEARLISWLAHQAFDAETQVNELDKSVSKLGREDEVFSRLEPWMGTYTAAVVVTSCEPRQYENAAQFEKACGLNLREKSSGEHKGRLSITKRGPGVIRKVLYLFALRAIQQFAVVRAWYVRRRGYSEESKQRAVIAVMRKLARATFHVARGAEFDATKLFDTRRLTITPVPDRLLNQRRRANSDAAAINVATS